MRNAKVHSDRLACLLKAANMDAAAATPRPAGATEILVWGFLAWECSQSRALHAYERLRSRIVDLNELRVCLTNEIQGLIGDRYPRARLRAERIRRVLRDIYRREMMVSIDCLCDAPASDAAAYLTKLDGMIPFAADFACLHALHHPIIPIDDRLLAALIEEGIADPCASSEEVSEAIVDHVEPEHCAAAHLHLWAWVDTRDAAEPTLDEDTGRTG